MEEGSKFSGMVCRSDVELAKELRSARAEYESWYTRLENDVSLFVLTASKGRCWEPWRCTALPSSCTAKLSTGRAERDKEKERKRKEKRFVFCRKNFLVFLNLCFLYTLADHLLLFLGCLFVFLFIFCLFLRQWFV